MDLDETWAHQPFVLRGHGGLFDSWRDLCKSLCLAFGDDHGIMANYIMYVTFLKVYPIPQKLGVLWPVMN